MHRPGGDGAVLAAVLHRRADHVATIAARHAVDGLRAQHVASDRLLAARMLRIAQDEQLPLHGVGARGLVDAIDGPGTARHDHAVGGGEAWIIEPADRRVLVQLGPTPAGRDGQREGHGARVDPMVARHMKRPAQPGREIRFQATRLAGREQGAVERLLAADRGLALEPATLIGIARDEQRAVGLHQAPRLQGGIGLELRGERRPGGRRLEPELQQQRFGGVGLADGREHPRGDARRLTGQRTALEELHAGAAASEPPGDRQPDDAASDDAHVRTHAVRLYARGRVARRPPRAERQSVAPLATTDGRSARLSSVERSGRAARMPS